MKKLFLGAFLTFCIGAIAQEYKYGLVIRLSITFQNLRDLEVMLIIGNGAWTQLR